MDLRETLRACSNEYMSKHANHEGTATVNKFTVTLPDGTTVTRTSKSRIYTHAVVVTESAAIHAAEAREMEGYRAAEAAARLIDIEHTAVTVGIPEGSTRPAYVLGGSYVGLYSVRRGEVLPAPSLAEARAYVAERLAEALRAAAAYAAKAEALENGPANIYTVQGFSQSAANAAKMAASVSGRAVTAVEVVAL